MNYSPPISRTQKFFHCTLVAIMLLSLALAGAQPPAARQSYIIQGPNLEQVAGLVRAAGGEVTARLEIIDGLVADLTPRAAAALQDKAAIRSVFPNSEVRAAANDNSGGNPSTPATDYPDVVGADVVWANGVTGSGVTVAVVDSGIIVNGQNFNNLVGWMDFVDGSNNPKDPLGHGTHVSGVIANAEIGEDGEANGVAPGVNLVAVRVLDKHGMSTYARVIQGVEWVVANKDVYNIRVLNLSLVAPALAPYWADPLNQAVTQAWAEGIFVVAAAGNSGPTAMSITVPGNNPYALTVGAFTDHYTPDNWGDDYVTPFSSTGPTYDAFVKPDVVAPGGHMVSLLPNNSTMAKDYKDNKVTGQYYSLAGTSQSAAVVSGIAALALQANPQLTPDELKYRIQLTAFPWVDPTTGEAQYSIWQQGFGRVSAPDAVFQSISGSANSGLDIAADLAGTEHYLGGTIFDPVTGQFMLGNGLENWDNGFAQWDGAVGNWAGAVGNWAGYTTWDAAVGNWAGGFGSWAGAVGNWAGGFGSWAGGFGSWAGAVGSWAGGFGSWAGGFGSWAGAVGSWAGGFGSWAGAFGSWAGAFGSWAGATGNWAGAIGSWAGATGNWAGGYGSWAGAIGSWAGTVGNWAGAMGSWAGSLSDPTDLP